MRLFLEVFNSSRYVVHPNSKSLESVFVPEHRIESNSHTLSCSSLRLFVHQVDQYKWTGLVNQPMKSVYVSSYWIPLKRMIDSKVFDISGLSVNPMSVMATNLGFTFSPRLSSSFFICPRRKWLVAFKVIISRKGAISLI